MVQKEGVLDICVKLVNQFLGLALLGLDPVIGKDASEKKKFVHKILAERIVS